MLSVQHIHPILVHFPIVFMITLGVVDLVAAARGKVITGRGAVGNLSLGLALAAGAFAVASYFFGDMALEIAESGGFHSDIAEAHEALGEAVAVAFAIWALIRLGLWWRDLRLAGGGAFAVAGVGAGTIASAMLREKRGDAFRASINSSPRSRASCARSCARSRARARRRTR